VAVGQTLERSPTPFAGIKQFCDPRDGSLLFSGIQEEAWIVSGLIERHCDRTKRAKQQRLFYDSRMS